MEAIVKVTAAKVIDGYNEITATAQMRVAGSEESIRQALDNFPAYTLLCEALSDLEDKEKATKEILEKINNESA